MNKREDLGDRQHEIGNFSLIYANHADSVIDRYFNERRPEKISRAKIEMEIVELVEKSNFPLPYRLAMYSMVTNTDVFELYWRDKRYRLNLDEEATARLRPNYDLIFDIPAPFSPITCSSGSTTGSVEADTPGQQGTAHEPKESNPPGPITPSHPDFEWEVLDVSKCEQGPSSTSSTSSHFESSNSVESTSSPDSPVVREPTPAPPDVVQEPAPATETAGLTPAATPAPGATSKETSEPPTKRKRTYTKKRAAPAAAPALEATRKETPEPPTRKKRTYTKKCAAPTNPNTPEPPTKQKRTYTKKRAAPANPNIRQCGVHEY